MAAAAELRALRARVRYEAQQTSLGFEEVEALVTAASEVATNSLEHGGGTANVRLWNESGGFVCEVSDAGHIKDPEVGHRLPPTAHLRGRGLWLVRQLCDAVELHSGPMGTVVRMYMAS